LEEGRVDGNSPVESPKCSELMDLCNHTQHEGRDGRPPEHTQTTKGGKEETSFGNTPALVVIRRSTYHL